MADEINRTTPKTQSALLEAMNEAQVTVDNRTYPLPQPFMVLATQNPVEHHGTYPLPESQLDRFLFRVRMGYPDRASEKEILRELTGRSAVETLDPVMEAHDIAAMQRTVECVRVDDTLLDYALEIVARTRASEQFSLGVSTRGALMLHRAAQARAFLHGRDFCLPDDFKQLVVSRVRAPRDRQCAIDFHAKKVRANGNPAARDGGIGAGATVGKFRLPRVLHAGHSLG